MDPLADLPDVTALPPGKVRERYLVDGRLLLVASDRISAYDCVLPTAIPDKGRVLTGMSDFWFDHLGVDHHRITCDVDRFPAAVRGAADALRGRAMLCHVAQALPVECVVRGYLAGSAWVEYLATGAVGGIRLSHGLVESQRLPVPMFTPTTKATDGGHDEPLSFAELSALVGAERAAWLRDTSLALYARAAGHVAERGLLLADTKFEFGTVDGRPLLIDEAVTPDSSRLWPADGYRPGGPQPSVDKQYVRDWLTRSGWDRRPPAPELPDAVVDETRRRYVAVYEQVTDRRFQDWIG